MKFTFGLDLIYVFALNLNDTQGKREWEDGEQKKQKESASKKK